MVVFAACAGLFIAYTHGFRVFDGNMWNGDPKERNFLSIPELLVFFGSIGLGIAAAVVSLASAVFWLVQHLRHTSNANNRDA